MLRDMDPAIGRAAMLVYPETTQPDRAFFLNPFEEAARSLGVSTLKAEVTDFQGIELVFETLAKSGPTGAVIVTPHASFANHSKEIVALAERFQIATSYPYRYYATSGWPRLIRGQQSQPVQTGRALCRQDPARHKAQRSARAATDTI